MPGITSSTAAIFGTRCFLRTIHASEHLWAIGRALYGAQTPQTTAWVEPLLHHLRHGGQARVVRGLQELITPAAPRSAETQQLIEREANYFKTHEPHMNYKAIHRAGAPIGSGAVESPGAQLQRRFRCSGQFWMRPGLSNLLGLAVLFRNNDERYLWELNITGVLCNRGVFRQLHGR